jgi:type III restriction enzyme
MMMDGIKYEKIAGKYFEMKLFENEELTGYLQNLKPVNDQDKTLYDYVQVDSDIEKKFARELEDNEQIKFYVKLPRWFTIDTPIGKYNPDWAFVLENDKRIYFVAETKGTLDDFDLRQAENMKIKCGKKHFERLDGVKFNGPVEKLSNALFD